MEDKEIDSQLILLNEIVEKIQDEEKNPWINKILDRYMVSSRPYCPASFSAPQFCFGHRAKLQLCFRLES